MVEPTDIGIKKFIDSSSSRGENESNWYSIAFEGVFHPTNERSFMVEETNGFKT